MRSLASVFFTASAANLRASKDTTNREQKQYIYLIDYAEMPYILYKDTTKPIAPQQIFYILNLRSDEVKRCSACWLCTTRGTGYVRYNCDKWDR